MALPFRTEGEDDLDPRYEYTSKSSFKLRTDIYLRLMAMKKQRGNESLASLMNRCLEIGVTSMEVFEDHRENAFRQAARALRMIEELTGRKGPRPYGPKKRKVQ